MINKVINKTNQLLKIRAAIKRTKAIVKKNQKVHREVKVVDNHQQSQELLKNQDFSIEDFLEEERKLGNYSEDLFEGFGPEVWQEWVQRFQKESKSIDQYVAIPHKRKKAMKGKRVFLQKLTKK